MPAHNIAVLVVARDAPAGPVRSLAPWGGSTLLESIVRQARGWDVGDVVVVLGRAGEEALERCDLEKCTVVLDPEWDEGSASSLRVGLDTLVREGRYAGALIVWADVPGIPDRAVAALVERYADTGSRAVVPKYRYAWGVPVLLDATLWDRVMGAEGESRLESLLGAHPEWVEEVWVDALPPRRIVTESDAADLRPRGRPG